MIEKDNILCWISLEWHFHELAIANENQKDKVIIALNVSLSVACLMRFIKKVISFTICMFKSA